MLTKGFNSMLIWYANKTFGFFRVLFLSSIFKPFFKYKPFIYLRCAIVNFHNSFFFFIQKIERARYLG